MAFRLSSRATDDLRGIYLEGLRRFGEAQANRYHTRLETAFVMLGDNPKLARERAEISPPVRIHPVGAHIILYVEDEVGGALIVRVRHGREDWGNSP